MVSNWSLAKNVTNWEEDPSLLRMPGRVDDRLLFETCDKMRLIGKTINQIADTDVPVLILGESGTGKELVANAIHFRSTRKAKQLITVNCMAIPGELLESELFGYERGAFTGAYNSKPGRFEYAHKGTLFLDEIGDMPLSLQGKLLRTLQEGVFFRLGGNEEIRVDIRIITATNQDLESAIKKGSFREDLFYRLNVIKLQIPPLRERKEVIYPLAEHFMEKYCRANNKTPRKLSERNLRLLIDYDWPGNVRELENVLKKFVVLEKEGITLTTSTLKDTPQVKEKTDGEDIDYLQDFSMGLSLKEIGKRAAVQAERVALKKVLEYTQWNRTRAAEIMKVSYKTLLNKIKETGLG